MTRVTHDIGRQLRRCNTDASRTDLVESITFNAPFRLAPTLADIAVVRNGQTRLDGGKDPARHFQRVMVTRVPTPTCESSSNSLTKRRAPVRPSPKPWPEVQPSVIASSRLGMPGP